MAEAARHGSVMSGTAASLAKTYAEALLGAVPDDEAAEEVCKELAGLVSLLDEVAGFDELLTGALLNRHEKCELIERVFRGRVSEPVEGFLTVLARRGRLVLLRAAAGRFRGLLNNRQGRLEVAVTSAVPLDASRREAIAAALGEAMGAETVLTTRVDRRLLGGMTVRVGDRLYDGSVAAALGRLQRRLGRGGAGPDEAGARIAGVE